MSHVRNRSYHSKISGGFFKLQAAVQMRQREADAIVGRKNGLGHTAVQVMQQRGGKLTGSGAVGEGGDAVPDHQGFLREAGDTANLFDFKQIDCTGEAHPADVVQ